MAAKAEFNRFFARDPVPVARELVGARLLFAGAGGIIVETEAYAHDDPASHSFAGPNTRNAAMFGTPGTAYVYRSYGIHWCLNFTCGKGNAVLIRALEPQVGIARMRKRRGVDDIRVLCRGPGNLTKALGIDGEDNGLPLDAPPFALSFAEDICELVTGCRIGLTRAVDVPWRFGLAGSRFVSRAFPETR